MTCPIGDDPQTSGQSDEKQILACTDDDNDGSIVLTFRDQSTRPLLPSSSLHDVKTALEALTSIEEVAVETVDPNAADSLCTSAGNEFMVTFLTEHGDLPLITASTQNIITFETSEYVPGECSTSRDCLSWLTVTLTLAVCLQGIKRIWCAAAVGCVTRRRACVSASTATGRRTARDLRATSETAGTCSRSFEWRSKGVTESSCYLLKLHVIGS